MSETPDNLALWNSVETTDPAMTKHVDQRGGFTAICAQYQIKNATALWGPYGTAWGVYECQYEYLRDKAGDIVEVALLATFHYPCGSFPIGADCAFRVGNDTRKKLLTDATTKALSKLGFNADVFMGKFDDNKYVAEARAKFAPPPPDPALQPPTQLEKVAMVGAVKKLLMDSNVDPVYAAALILKVSAHKLQKPRPQTVGDLDAILEAIHEGEYILDSGEPTPEAA